MGRYQDLVNYCREVVMRFSIMYGTVVMGCHAVQCNMWDSLA